MQDKYAGDVGDFGKFVLLRQLLAAGGRGLRLGINWYRVTCPEIKNNDGRHIGYLNPEVPAAARFQSCDPAVYSGLKAIVQARRRSVHALEGSGLLPGRTIFFSKPVPYGAGTMTDRIVARENWFAESLKKLAPANMIFLDPDNGIPSESVRVTQSRSIKYTLDDEVCSYARGCSLVIVYNHRDHSPDEKYLQKFRRVHDLLGGSTSMRLLRFKRISARDYVFFFKRGAASTVDRLVDTLTATPFDFLFEETPGP